MAIAMSLGHKAILSSLVAALAVSTVNPNLALAASPDDVAAATARTAEKLESRVAALERKVAAAPSGVTVPGSIEARLAEIAACACRSGEYIGKVVELEQKVDAWMVIVDRRISLTSGDVRELKRWRVEIDEWRVSVNDAIIDHEERLGELESWRDYVDPTLKRHDDAISGFRLYLGVQGYAGLGAAFGGHAIGNGFSTPVWGGGFLETNFRDAKSRWWILRGGGNGFIDPVLNETGVGGNLALGWITNPHAERPFSVLLAGEAWSLSTNVDQRDADAQRWDVRVGLDLPVDVATVDRFRFQIVPWARGGVGVGTQVTTEDGLVTGRESLVRPSITGGVSLTLAIRVTNDR